MSPKGIMTFSGVDTASAEAWIFLQITHPVIEGSEVKYNFLLAAIIADKPLNQLFLWASNIFKVQDIYSLLE